MSNPLPLDVFASLIPSLAEQLNELAASDNSNVEEAAASFRDKVDHARSLIRALPGGELGITEQDEVIRGLENLKESKRRQLDAFVSSGSDKASPALVASTPNKLSPEASNHSESARALFSESPEGQSNR